MECNDDYDPVGIARAVLARALLDCFAGADEARSARGFFQGGGELFALWCHAAQLDPAAVREAVLRQVVRFATDPSPRTAFHRKLFDGLNAREETPN